MKRSHIRFVCALVILLVLAGCGPSEEEIMQMTAAAATATPEPTPIPYDVTISIKDGEGLPVSGATVSIDDEEHIFDDSGQVVLSDLPDGSLNLSVRMPGYYPLAETASIERGPNQIELTLERDPDGLLMDRACTSDETLLYIEDFQDQDAAGWDLLEVGAPGWSMVPNPDSPDDVVIAAAEGAGFTTLAGFEDPGLGNAVWRFRFRYDGSGDSHINWRFAPGETDTRYILNLSPGNARLDRLVGNHVSIGEAGSPAEGQWHLMELSYFDGTVAVYIDGEEGFTWTDPNPWEGGTIALEPYPSGDAVFYYDDISLCGLSAPFSPLPPPQTGTHLTITVEDQDGNPLPKTTAFIPEMSSYAALATQVTDDTGKAMWNDLPGESVTLQLSAPGYGSLDETLTLQPGENSQKLTLTSDPNGLPLARACLPGETVLYLDDFQDGKAQDWEAIDVGIPTWSVTADPDNADDLVIAATEGAPLINMMTTPSDGFNNAIWRLWFRYDGTGDSHINWRWVVGEGDTRYILAMRPNDARLDRLADGAHVTIQQAGYPAKGEWHLLEMSYFEGEVTVFLDGKQSVVWQESNPWEGGTVSLEPYPSGDSVFYYDDMSICGLSEQPQSITVLDAEQ